MNRITNKKTDSRDLLSSSPIPPSHGVNRISTNSNISNVNSSHGAAAPTSGNNNASYSYMNLDQNNFKSGNSSNSAILRSPLHHLSHQSPSSYYTLGSPSISASYNSEEISDTNNSSLIDDDINLNGSLTVKVEQLQRQVETLTESQASQDERYTRTRKQNDDLLNKIHLLEDQLRELEIQSEIRSREDEKRFKETMAKQIKHKTQECELHLQTNYQLQQDIISLQKDLIKSEATIRTLRSEKEALISELNEKNSELENFDEEVHKLKLLVKQLKDEESVKSNIINILNEELEDNQNRSLHHHTSSSSVHPQTASPKQQSTSSRRSSVTSGFDDEISSGNAANNKALAKDTDVLEDNLNRLREENRRLKELNEELQAQLLNAQLEEGRSLLQEGNKSYSLADEMGDIDPHKLMEAYKDEQDDNARLRKYIDDILLKIVENNPEILDKTTTSTNGEVNKKGGRSA